jgi:hypothetical protein
MEIFISSAATPALTPNEKDRHGHGRNPQPGGVDFGILGDQRKLLRRKHPQNRQMKNSSNAGQGKHQDLYR